MVSERSYWGSTKWRVRNSRYLSYHPVLKPDSEMTKVRLVFNMSCKVSLSLNDCLIRNLNLKEEIHSTLLNFMKSVLESHMMQWCAGQVTNAHA